MGKPQLAVKLRTGELFAAKYEKYQKKRSPTHTNEEEEEGFTQTTRSALSQRALLDPNKPAYNQSRLDGQLKLTASAFN